MNDIQIVRRKAQKSNTVIKDMPLGNDNGLVESLEEGERSGL